jgi:hypothetical protein
MRALLIRMRSYFKIRTSCSFREVSTGMKKPRNTPTNQGQVENHFELVMSLPQHSGCGGSSELFQPPPRA